MTWLVWEDGSGFDLELFVTLADAESCSGPGDAEPAVRDLLADPEIAAQVAAWDPARLRGHLLEYGAWEESDLVDLEMCRVRQVWLACCEIAEDPAGAEMW